MIDWAQLDLEGHPAAIAQIPLRRVGDCHDDVGRVLYVGTFSKTLLPSLRIAYLVLPPELVETFRMAMWLSDWAAPTFEQEVLARFLTSGDFERQLRRARTLYAASRARLVESIETEMAAFRPTFHDSRAGLHLLVRFEGVPRARHRELLTAARASGIEIYPAAPCYVSAPSADSHLGVRFGIRTARARRHPGGRSPLA